MSIFSKIFMMAVCTVSLNLTAQPLQLTGPSSWSFCDYSDLSYSAVALGYADSDFDDVDWRYRFSLWKDGSSVANYTNGGVAAWTITTADYEFGSGPYQVKCEVQYKWGFTWITSETLWSNGITLDLYGNTGEYDSDKTSYRMVSGDFDHDGKEDDVAAFYDYGNNNTAIHVWKSNGSSLAYQGDAGWWYGTSFNATKTTAKVVSGDFDRDGIKDDIAAFYDYGNNHTEVHVWSSTGTALAYQGVWWSTGSGASGYDATKITGTVVSGDFDRDGYEDDICAFYDYGSGLTKGFVWKSNSTTSSPSTGFNSPETWYNSGSGMFEAPRISGKVVSGDFDRDGFKDDIAAMYAYSDVSTSAFVWKSNGTSSLSTAFSSPTSWYASGAGNFDGNKITGKTVALDFDQDTKSDDIVGLYYYGNLSTRFFAWESTSTSFESPYFVWEICHPSVKKSLSIDEDQDALESQFIVYPNPSTGVFSVTARDVDIQEVEVLDMTGKRVMLIERAEGFAEATIDLSAYPPGIYYAVIRDGNTSVTKKMTRL